MEGNNKVEKKEESPVATHIKLRNTGLFLKEFFRCSCVCVSVCVCLWVHVCLHVCVQAVDGSRGVGLFHSLVLPKMPKVWDILGLWILITKMYRCIEFDF